MELFQATLAQPELLPSGDPENPNREPNPCRRLYGPGPEGRTCKACAHLQAGGVQGGHEGHHCELRSFRGTATNHRTGWRACARFTPKLARP